MKGPLLPEGVKDRPGLECHSLSVLESAEGLKNIPAVAIIFVVAEWSGPATCALQYFVDRISNFHEVALRIYFLYDHDDRILEAAEILGFPIHGYGETALIRDGKVVLHTSFRKGRDYKGEIEQILSTVKVLIT